MSEPRPGAVSVMERRAHADRVQRLPVDLPDDIGESFLQIIIIIDFNYALDLMIEVGSICGIQ